MIRKKVRGTEALLLSLIAEGTDTIFGYPGGTIMPFYDDLYHYSGQINHILVRHEQGAVHAAEGYARSTGKAGVCIATAGPGATNFVTGIADAMLDSTPLICITAQVNADKLGTNFFQEADTIGITLPITKWSYQITGADEIPQVMAKAFYIARSGRPGPVVISVAKNAQVEMTDFAYDQAELLKDLVSKDKRAAADGASEEEIARAASAINAAERPLIIAGQGVTISGAENELAELARRGNIPVATTLLGISCIPSADPLYVGKVGMHGNIAPNKMTQEADLIIAAGMRFSDRVTGETHGYAPKARIIHIEIDRAEVNKNIRADLPLIGDAKNILARLNRAGIESRPREEWFGFARKEAEAEYERIIAPELSGGGKRIRMGQVIDRITKAACDEAIIVTDVGQNQMFAARYAKFKNKRSWITSGGLGTMGFGLPAAIGAKTGNPDRNVVAILGDGGFQMNIQELGTVMQSGIGVKIVLLNNTYLGMVRQWQELFFGKRYSFTHLDNPDFQQILAAYRIPARKVTDPQELEEAVSWLFSTDGPAFLEAAVLEEENVFPMIPAGATLDDIIYDKYDK